MPQGSCLQGPRAERAGARHWWTREALTLLLFFVYLHGFEIFGLEDFPAIEAFEVIDTVPTGDHLGAGMVTSGLHNLYGPWQERDAFKNPELPTSSLDEIYSSGIEGLVKPPKVQFSPAGYNSG